MNFRRRSALTGQNGEFLFSFRTTSCTRLKNWFVLANVIERTAPSSVNLTLRQNRFLSGQAAASHGGNKLDDLNIEKYKTMHASFKILSVILCFQVAAGGGAEKTRFLKMATVTGRLLFTGPGKHRLAPATTAAS